MPKVPRAAAGQGQGPAPPKKAAHQLRPYRRPRNKQELRVSQLILQALSARKQRGGLSLASLRKALLANGYDVEKNQARVQLAIKSLVSNGSLVQTKTTGSFKLGEQQQQQPQPQPQQSKGAGTEAKAGAQLQSTGEAAGSTGEDKSAAKKPRKRRTEKKAKPRRPRK